MPKRDISIFCELDNRCYLSYIAQSKTSNFFKKKYEICHTFFQKVSDIVFEKMHRHILFENVCDVSHTF